MTHASCALPLRLPGQTGFQVTPIRIGCTLLGNSPETLAYSVAEDQAIATLTEAFRSPINFPDTATAYGDGESERRIGVVLRNLSAAWLHAGDQSRPRSDDWRFQR
jgi:D-threo-aldose 1-dehydrogenase